MGIIKTLLIVCLLQIIGFAQTNKTIRENDVAFDGNRVVKRAGLPAVNVGTTTDIMDFIEAYFFPAIAATISLTTDSTIFEIGGTYFVDLSADITVNDDNSFTLGYINQVLPSEIVYVSGSTDTLITYTVTYLPTVKQTTQYQAGTTGDVTGAITNNTYHYSIYPQFYGMSVNDFEDSSAVYYTSLTKSVIREPSTIERSYVAPTSQYLYFVYPNGDGLLSGLDYNSAGTYFDDSASWSNFTVTITSVGLTNDYTETFRVYRTNLVKTTAETLTYRFTF